MNLEFFDERPQGRAVVLLYDGSCDEVTLLRRAFRTLGEGVNRALELHELPFVRVVDGSRLTALVSPTDEGVDQRGSGDFVWILDPEGWLQAEELLEPFECARDPEITSFQHLSPSHGIEVIYSTHRGW